LLQQGYKQIPTAPNSTQHDQQQRQLEEQPARARVEARERMMEAAEDAAWEAQCKKLGGWVAAKAVPTSNE
jgi:hypothetical protein